MDIFREIGERIRKIDIFEMVERIILEIETIILDINTDEQLFKYGIDSEGNKLEPYSIREYSDYKFLLNPSHRSIPDLKLTGKFYEGFILEIKNGVVYIWSRDSKTDKLVQLYSKNIFGLTQANWDKVLNDEIAPRLVEELRRRIAT